MNRPARYSTTDTAEQLAIAVFKCLINPEFIKEDVRSRDKYPNTDGIVEIVDRDQTPIGKLEVQIRKIPSDQRSYSCPTSLAAYSTRTTLPIILICVDVDAKKAYWRHITTSMPEYRGKESQGSFIIHFSEDSYSIDERQTYIRKWTEIVNDYQERISKYPVLRSEAAEELELVPMNSNERELFQRYIDTINNLLDKDLKVLKNLLLPPNTWKVGVGVVYSDDTHFGYHLFAIPYGKSSPLVCRLEGKQLFSKDATANTFSEILCPRTEFRNPEEVGKRYLLDELHAIAAKRKFRIYGKLVSSEIIYSFIRRYNRCLGLTPNLDNYSATDFDHAFNFHLLGLCSAFAKESGLETSTGYISIDLDQLSQYLSSHPLTTLPPDTTPRFFRLDSSLFSIRSVVESLDYLIAAEIKTIFRPFAKRKPGARRIWEGFSTSDEIQSVAHVLENAVSEYSEFVEKNQFHFPNSHFLNEETAIVFEYKPALQGDSISRPKLSQYLVRNINGYLPKVYVFVSSDDDHFLDLEEHLTMKVKSNSFSVIAINDFDGAFLFHDTPIYDLIYKMLSEDLRQHFNLSIL